MDSTLELGDSCASSTSTSRRIYASRRGSAAKGECAAELADSAAVPARTAVERHVGLTGPVDPPMDRVLTSADGALAFVLRASERGLLVECRHCAVAGPCRSYVKLFETEAEFSRWCEIESVRIDPPLYEQLRRQEPGSGWSRECPTLAASQPQVALLRPEDVLASIGKAQSTLSALSLFRRMLDLVGAESGVFVSRIRDDAMGTSYRALLSCDSRWVEAYRERSWHDRCPWFRHALERDEPVRDTELPLLSHEESDAEQMRACGFASSVIVPAPSSMGGSRIGVLCVGARRQGFFEGAAFDSVAVALQGLAMQLHRWALRTMRAEWLARSGITDAELDLLRHEVAGHSSQTTADAVGVSHRTIDVRLQRLIGKLDVPDRRTAARVARLYALL